MLQAGGECGWMIAKLIVTGATREIAIARMQRALNEFFIKGIKTTIPFQDDILSTADFREGNYNINWVEKFIDQNRQSNLSSSEK